MKAVPASALRAAGVLDDDLRLLSCEDLTDAPEVSPEQAMANRSKAGMPRTPRAARKVLLGVSEATLKRWVAEGQFPKPMKLGPRMNRWPARVVREWIERRSRLAAVK